MRWLSQTLAVMALNFRTIPQRLSSSAVAIVGIAGVVVVFLSVLSIAAGFSTAMTQSGSPRGALVMRSGADSEMTSGLVGPEVDIVKQAPGMQRDGQTALASAELYVIVDVPPVLPLADAMLVGQYADAVVFSVLRDVSRVPAVWEAYQRLASLGAACPLLAEALPYIAHPQIRNRGTIGGSVAHADPAALELDHHGRQSVRLRLGVLRDHRRESVRGAAYPHGARARLRPTVTVRDRCVR